MSATTATYGAGSGLAVRIDDAVAPVDFIDRDDETQFRQALASRGTAEVRVAPGDVGDTEGHAMTAETVRVRIRFPDEFDTAGHAIALRFPTAEEARAFQVKMLATGALVGTLVVGGVAAANIASAPTATGSEPAPVVQAVPGQPGGDYSLQGSVREVPWQPGGDYSQSQSVQAVPGQPGGDYMQRDTSRESDSRSTIDMGRGRARPAADANAAGAGTAGSVDYMQREASREADAVGKPSGSEYMQLNASRGGDAAAVTDDGGKPSGSEYMQLDAARADAAGSSTVTDDGGKPSGSEYMQLNASRATDAANPASTGDYTQRDDSREADAAQGSTDRGTGAIPRAGGKQ